MNQKILGFSVLAAFACTSCQQLKSLTAQDNSISKPVAKVGRTRQVRFLDISVTPGQVVTSRHASIGPSAPKSHTVNEPVYDPARAINFPAGDRERGDWLQVKYSVILNSSPETLTNTSLLQTIDEWWGTRYSMGGSTKDGIDCSAFTQVIMSNVYGISLPRTSSEQHKISGKVDDDELTEGDLIFFGSGRSISHVGIYLTNNKFVHASTSQGVMVSDLNESYWKSKYKGGGRVR
jgi:cell wall-associated NlpC family hydrolase